MNKDNLIEEATHSAAFITGDDGFDVAVLQRVADKLPCGEPRTTDAEWQSLVNLVNAAPELLSAARTALDAITDMFAALRFHPDHQHVEEKLLVARDRTRAAITKAEGRAE